MSRQVSVGELLRRLVYQCYHADGRPALQVDTFLTTHASNIYAAAASAAPSDQPQAKVLQYILVAAWQLLEELGLSKVGGGYLYCSFTAEVARLYLLPDPTERNAQRVEDVLARVRQEIATFANASQHDELVQAALNKIAHAVDGRLHGQSLNTIVRLIEVAMYELAIRLDQPLDAAQQIGAFQQDIRTLVVNQ